MAHLDAETVERLIGLDLGQTAYTYSARDAALYALGIGAPADPLDQEELKFVYEKSRLTFQALPTFAFCFSTGLIAKLLSGRLGHIEYEPLQLLHAEQQLELPRPLPPAATVRSRHRIAEILDKGSGMLIRIHSESFDESGQALALARWSVFIRGLGGYGGNRGTSAARGMPNRPPDVIHEEKTAPAQALLYRLSGDANPLHADPEMATRGNFEKPILHGLCTLGFAARALLAHFGGNQARSLRAISARFASHVFPGETLRTEMWRLAAGEIAFQTRVKERPALALSQARARMER